MSADPTARTEAAIREAKAEGLSIPQIAERVGGSVGEVHALLAETGRR